MSMIEHGTYGVKRQSLRKGNPRNFICNLLERNPRISDEELREKVKNAALKNEDYLDAIIEYWVAGERRNLTRPTRPVQEKEEVRKERAEVKAAQVTKFVEVIKERAEKMVLLEMVMPNSKRLADCTFKEVAQFGSKFTALSKGGKPTEKVGKLSETAVRKLFR